MSETLGHRIWEKREGGEGGREEREERGRERRDRDRLKTAKEKNKRTGSYIL